MPLESVERRHLYLEAARLSGALLASGTATAGTGTTIADTVHLTHPNNNDFRGVQVYIHTGTGLGQSRVASASTSASSLLTVPTWTTTPSTDSQFYAFRRPFVVELYQSGLDDALRRIRGKYLVDKVTEEYVFQDLLWGYGAMERWTNGVSAAPDGWTLDGNSSIARSSTIADRLLFSAAVTSDGTNAGSLSRSITQFAEYRDLGVSVRGWIFANTASRVTLRATDGTTTVNSSALTTTSTWFEVGGAGDLTMDELSIGANPTELTVSLQISSGGAVVANVDNLRLILNGRNLQHYELPAANGYGSELTSFRYLNEIAYEDRQQTWDYNRVLDPRYTRIIDRDGTRFLQIDRTDITTLADVRMQLRGQEDSPLLTADTSTTTVDAVYLANYMAWYALGSINNKTTDQEKKFVDTEILWRERERTFRSKARGNSIKVEVT